mgnify:CR=1 FL=1
MGEEKQKQKMKNWKLENGENRASQFFRNQ